MTSPLAGPLRIAGIDTPVSRLALGTAFYALASREQSFALLDGFVAAGGTLIDSGRCYGDSEAVIGEWLASRGDRERVIITTKCGASGNREDGLLPDEDFADLLRTELSTSLRCLQLDAVDLYMLHRDNPAIPVAAIIEPLNEELARGRVRALGASNWTYDRVDAANAYARAHGLAGFSVVSNNLSLGVPAGPFYPGLISTDAAGERWHATTGIPLVVWSSQARGFFTSRYTPEMARHPEAAADGFTRRMLEVYGTEANFARLQRAEQLGRQRGCSAVQIALAWLLSKPLPVVPIVGPRTPEELVSCIEAVSIELTPEELRWLSEG